MPLDSEYYCNVLYVSMELAAECMNLAMIGDDKRAEIGSSVYDMFFSPALSTIDKICMIQEEIGETWKGLIKLRKDRGETFDQQLARPKKVIDNDWFWHRTVEDETLSKEEKVALVMKLFRE